MNEDTRIQLYHDRLRDELDAMCGLRRLLSFKKRKALRIAAYAVQYEAHFIFLEQKEARQEREKMVRDWEDALLEDRIRRLELNLIQRGCHE